MITSSSLEYKIIKPKDGHKPQNLVFLLHGIGANKDDLLPLGHEWSNTLPHTAFISPDAPFPYDMAPVGFQWFSIQNREPRIILSEIKNTAVILNRFIDEMCQKLSIAPGHFALAGFSQGAMMALHVGPRRKSSCAAILSYSGMIIEGDELKTEAVCKPPVLVMHGTEDQVVLPVHFDETVSILEKAGIQVEKHLRRGLGHGIDDKGVELGHKFLERHLLSE